MRINGFQQLSAFYGIVFSGKHDFKPQHISLYIFLLNQNNRNNWAEWFKMPLDLGLTGSCIGSKKTYYQCLEDLHSWGLIEYVPGENAWKAAKVKVEVLKATSTYTTTVPQSEPQPTPQGTPLPAPQPTPIIKHVTGNSKQETNTALRAEVQAREEKAIALFEEFRKAYPGTKRGHETELKTFRKHKDWMDVADILMDRLNAEIQDRQTRRKLTSWESQWKHLQTYLNGRFWEAYENSNATTVDIIPKLDLSLTYERDKEKGQEQIRTMAHIIGYKNCSQRELIWAYDFQRPYGFLHEEHKDDELLMDRGLPGTKANPNSLHDILKNG